MACVCSLNGGVTTSRIAAIEALMIHRLRISLYMYDG